MNILLNWIQLISKFWIEFWIEFTIQKLFWIIFWIEFCRNIYIEFFVELNLDESNENESYIESIFWIFNWKAPLLVYFGHFLGTFFIQPVSMIPWLLNWIIYWIESPQFVLNLIIVWIEFWETNIEWNIELNQFFPKFKLWIELFWVSIMAARSPVSSEDEDEKEKNSQNVIFDIDNLPWRRSMVPIDSGRVHLGTRLPNTGLILSP